MNRFIKYFFLTILFFYSCKSTDHKAFATLISEALLKEDFTVFRKTLEEGHPGFYWYTEKHEMDDFLDSLYQEIDHPMSDEDYFKLLLPAIGKIRCVHTQLRLSESTQRNLFSNIRILPLDVAILDGKLFVTKSYDSLPAPGFEITAINDAPVVEILKKMMEIIPSDGFNTSHKYHVLKSGFREAYGLLFGQPEQFKISGKDSRQNLVQFILKSQTPDQIPSSADNIPLQLNFIKDNKIAILTVRTFQTNSILFENHIDSFFSEIEKNKVNKLIIDMRNNEGGNNANVTTFYSYIALHPFLHLKKTEVKTKDLTYSNYIPNFSQLHNIVATKTPDGTFEVDAAYPGRTLKQPVARHAFTGKLIVLVNGGTVSAASEFVALVHGYERGMVIGEEAGGCYYGATGGVYLNLVLPNSQLRVTIPTVKILIAVPEDSIKQPKGRGVIPDLIVTPTSSDLINHRDPEMKAAIDIMEAPAQ